MWMKAYLNHCFPLSSSVLFWLSMFFHAVSYHNENIYSLLTELKTRKILHYFFKTACSERNWLQLKWKCAAWTRYFVNTHKQATNRLSRAHRQLSQRDRVCASVSASIRAVGGAGTTPARVMAACCGTLVPWGKGERGWLITCCTERLQSALYRKRQW